MKNKITEEIQQSIEKNLPQQVGVILQKRLKKADETEEAYNLLQTKYSQKCTEFSTSQIKVGELQSQLRTHKSITLRENEVREKEIVMEVNILKYKLEAETDKTKHSRELVMGLVRNTTYKKDVFANQNTMGQSTPDGYVDPISSTSSNNEIITEE
ncbi:hypothetical protein [Clostridium sp.]|jgi:hypothetical protein|uniref:hypothetical protein n=1 Tax=Clostridium sp. TaxID=1506 RepID=UPI003EEDF31D